MDASKDSLVKSADRVLDILELVARRKNRLSHTDIALALGIPKSSLSKLLKNMTQRGYLTLSAESHYDLGSALFALASAGKEAQNFKDIAQWAVERLTERTNESSAFSVLNGSKVERICGATSSHVLNYAMNIGVQFPLYSSSAGKAILAFLPEDERERYLAGVRLKPITKSTVTSMKQLRRELTETRERGYSFTFEEQVEGIAGMACPVLGMDGRPVGALSISLPIARLSDTLKRRLTTELLRINRALQTELHAGVTQDAA